MASIKQSLESDTPVILSEAYVRSLKSGKVQKIVREVYLRQDIPCSSKLCNGCLRKAPRDAAGRTSPFVLSDKPAKTKTFPQGHYLVPDTNAFLNAMDLFESASAFCDVVVLQVVLEEVRNRSLPLYNRLVGLTRSEEKRFYVFFNEFRLETHVQRLDEETVNDRNDRAVRRAVAWYKAHLAQSVGHGNSKKLGAAAKMRPPAVVMLSNDRDNVGKAKSEGLDALTLAEYVGQLEHGDRLLDMVGETQDDETTRARKRGEHVYPEYWPISRMATGVKKGVLHQGVFNASPYNYLEGSVRVAAFLRALIIVGRENINRAVDGDVVVVEVLPKDQWKEPSTQVVEEEAMTKDDNVDAEEAGDLVSVRERKALQEEVRKTHAAGSEGRAQPTAKVVGVVRRNWRQFVGHIDPSSVSPAARQATKQVNVFVIAMDKKMPKMRLRTRQAGELLSKRILVVMDAWDRESRHPRGHLVRSLGEADTTATETEALLLEWDVQYRPFPRTVLDCLPREGRDWKVPASTDVGWVGREDLRDRVVCSIDPVGCQDIDDALHARLLANGNIEVGVHIADVSHFVQPLTAMDAEASVRGTTVYLVDKRIDMLPTLLGTDLCSLKPRVERYAFSVLWQLTPSAGVIDARFTKSVIRSRAALSYDQAQLRIDDASCQDEVTQGMRMLMGLSQLLRQQRLAAGALSLSSPEVKVQMESETSDPVDVKTKELLGTMSLVEEFMLLANSSVAARIYDAFPQTAMLRRHAAPPPTNFDELADQLKVKRGFVLDPETSKTLADSLDRATDAADPFFNTLVRILATRCMMSAEYFCSGSQAFPEFRHYGLASPIYTHFTSPIRRYADLVVHRQLAAAIGYEAVHPSLPSRGRLEAVCKNVNLRHRNAQMASRASVAYHVSQVLRSAKAAAEEDGFVLRVFSNGFVVLVPRFGLEGLVRLRDLADPEPEVDFDPASYTLRTRGSRSVTVELFQKVRVRVTDHKDEGTGKRGVRMDLLES